MTDHNAARTTEDLAPGHGSKVPHSALASEATYRSRFDAPLTVQARRLGLAYPGRDVRRPISESNQQLRDFATRHLDSQLPRGRMPFTTQVRQAIEALLDTGSCGHRQVAGTLYMHPRTMQRRLKDEGTTFEDIRDQLRRDLAERYLAEPELSLSQVTALLGYSEQSALGRSCRRWFHATPRDFRNRLLSRRTVRPSPERLYLHVT